MYIYKVDRQIIHTLQVIMHPKLCPKTNTLLVTVRVGVALLFTFMPIASLIFALFNAMFIAREPALQSCLLVKLLRLSCGGADSRSAEQPIIDSRPVNANRVPRSLPLGPEAPVMTPSGIYLSTGILSKEPLQQKAQMIAGNHLNELILGGKLLL